MGIPGFTTWFQGNNKEAYVPLRTIQVDHLYLDMNSILHSVLRKANSWTHFHKLLYIRLRATMEATQPRKTVMLAVDGPAPLAKLLTQRERRKKHALKDSHGGSKQAKRKKGAFISSNALTPGTPFMLDLELSLTYFVCQCLTTRKWGHLSFEISGPNVQGEGEVKILGRLARHWDQVGSNDTHVIVGDDADLILMALMSLVDNLYVLNAALSGGDVVPNSLCLSVKHFHHSWASSILKTANAHDPVVRMQLLGLKMDLTLIAVISNGNDYLPSLRGLSMEDHWGKSGVWSAYVKLRSQPAYQHRSLLTLDAAGHVSLDPGLMAALLSGFDWAPHGGGGDGGGSVDAQALHYLHGIVWMMEMYMRGCCPDYCWAYDGLGPTIRQFVAALQTFVAKGQSVTLSCWPVDPAGAAPLPPHVCALALLPGRSRDLAPRALLPLFNQDSPIHDIYHECQPCLTFSAEARAHQASMAAANQHITRLEMTLARLQAEGEAEAAEQVAAELKTHNRKKQAVKDQMNASSAARKRHNDEAHPPQQFPVQRLLQAAAAIPAAAWSPGERPLTQFGASHVFRRQADMGWRPTGGGFRPPGPPPGVESRSYSTGGPPATLTRLAVSEAPAVPGAPLPLSADLAPLPLSYLCSPDSHPSQHQHSPPASPALAPAPAPPNKRASPDLEEAAALAAAAAHSAVKKPRTSGASDGASDPQTGAPPLEQLMAAVLRPPPPHELEGQQEQGGQQQGQVQEYGQHGKRRRQGRNRGGHSGGTQQQQQQQHASGGGRGGGRDGGGRRGGGGGGRGGRGGGGGGRGGTTWEQPAAAERLAGGAPVITATWQQQQWLHPHPHRQHAQHWAPQPGLLQPPHAAGPPAAPPPFPPALPSSALFRAAAAAAQPPPPVLLSGGFVAAARPPHQVHIRRLASPVPRPSHHHPAPGQFRGGAMM